MNIIITGASSGIGFEAALELIKDSNNTVVAIARSVERLKNLNKIAKDLNPEAKLIPVQFDIVEGVYDDGLIPFLHHHLSGPIDILINNAGQLINKPFAEQTDEDWMQMFQVNVMGHVRIIRALLPYFNKPSHIVNIGSMGGSMGSSKYNGLVSYSASKSALHTITECLAEEFKELGISVNALALGSAQTEMLEQAFPGYQSPVMAFEMGKYIADFALTGNTVFNGKVLPVAKNTI